MTSRRRIMSLSVLVAALPLGLAAAAPAVAQPVDQPVDQAVVHAVVTAVGASKVPTMLRSLEAEIGASMATAHTGAISQARADELSVDVMSVDTHGGIGVLVHAARPVAATQLADLAGAGARVESAAFTPVPGMTLPTTGMVSAVIPYDRLDAVAALPWVTVLRPALRPAVDVGPVDTEGSRIHNAGKERNRGYTGAGEKIGAMSADVDNIDDAIAQGELPADVEVLSTASYTDDEGTAMLEIVHDMAPDAELAYASAKRSLFDYVEGFHDLAAAGSTLITEDLALDDEPAFQQGIGASTADELAKYGVWVSSSAGNLGARHAPRATATGTGSGPDGASGPYTSCAQRPDNVVALRGNDTTYDLSLAPGAQFLATLQWSEPRSIYPTEGQGGFTDLNLYLMDEDGTKCLDESNAVQANGVGDTIEQFVWANRSDETRTVKLVVDVQDTSTAVTAPLLDLRWRAYTAGVVTVDPTERAGSLNPDSNYLGYATSAGAVNATVSLKPKTIPLESYSAAGPVQIMTTTRCPDVGPGPCVGVAGPKTKTWQAPNWVAADGVSVSGAGGFGSGSCPTTETGECLFFGTSAAAPSATGVAALLRQEFGGHLTPVELNGVLMDRAKQRETDAYGAGVLRAAIKQ